MKRNLLLFMLCTFCVSMTSFAQITTGKPTAKQIKTGNRAEAGDYGIYLGVTSDMFKSLADGDISMKAMPLINLKYMKTDELEFRLGLEFWKKTHTYKGETYNEEESGEKIKDRSLESRNYIYPGAAYHFSHNNLLDVYVGAELPLGWERYKVSNESAYEGESYSATVSRGTFNIGLGAFIGLQAYIANLPLAVGVEYGLSSMFKAGLKYKHTSKFGKEKEQVYYTKDLKDESTKYNDLKAKQGEIGSQFRFTLTYYFK